MPKVRVAMNRKIKPKPCYPCKKGLSLHMTDCNIFWVSLLTCYIYLLFGGLLTKCVKTVGVTLLQEFISETYRAESNAEYGEWLTELRSACKTLTIDGLNLQHRTSEGM